jgi:hypothetical protein
MDFNIFSQADHAAFELEKAKRALEVAKSTLEAAKQAYDEVMSRAEESGISRSKFKKIVDERISALFDNGLADSTATGLTKTAARPDRPKKAKKADPEFVADIATETEHEKEAIEFFETSPDSHGDLAAEA